MSIVYIAFVPFLATAANAMSAAECTFQHTTSGEEGCTAIQTFALCLANVKASDPNLKSAEVLLATTQKDTTGCDIQVSPSFKVVDRELRVVTQEDVRFSRFRRDDVGVFELKGMIENNTDRISKTEQKIGKALDDALLTLKDQAEEAKEKASQEVEIAASWQFIANQIHPTNRREEVSIKVVGKNFQQYDYSPHAAPYFECTFTQDDKDKTEIVTAGQTQGAPNAFTGPSFTVLCPSPTSIAKKATFQLSLKWLGREDAVAIPYNGAAKKDLITFDMTWSSVSTRQSDGHVIVDVDGLNTDTKYTCKYTQPDNEDITKSTDGKFIGDKGLKMDCGLQPTGFAVSDISAAVVFELFIKGSKTKASYAGPTGEGPVVQLNTCFNTIKDGDETDKDCGGLCGGCGPMSVCKVDNDCANGVPCVDELCGLDGKTQETAAYTCKHIKKQFKDAKNGFYWVTGPNKEYTKANGKGPKKVMCWQEDRDGGGWTLAVKNWYGSHHSFAGNGMRQTNNINSGVLSNMGQYYKMDDREIRTYMGQANPEDDSTGAKKSEMNFMRDQSSYNSGHSHQNREYTVMKKYTGRWFWKTWQGMPESTTTHELSSYKMPHYSGGLTSTGDGELNWRGNAKCGKNGAGINCYSQNSGSPNPSPNGGHGCRENLALVFESFRRPNLDTIARLSKGLVIPMQTANADEEGRGN
eukprot:gene15817-24511_t